ncbi:MAG: phytanoyl-CoA dioxygenase family protein [Candidatus Poribacteria bacterium]
MNQYRTDFLRDNFVVIEDAFCRKLATEWVTNFNRVNGIELDRPSTWPENGAKLYPSNQQMHISEFSPLAYEVVCEFLGGEDQIETRSLNVGDGFNINFSVSADQEWQPPGPESTGYHKDGWFFKHFLDSPEQALLVLVIWSDIKPKSGGTFFIPDSADHIIKFLYRHPEGVNHNYGWNYFAKDCSDFRELTASAGDIVILHPFMLHARSNNPSGRIRYMNNKCVSLWEPFNFNRLDSNYNVIEEKCRSVIGDKIENFKITSPRVCTPDKSRLEITDG